MNPKPSLELLLQDCLDRIARGEDDLESALARHPQAAERLRPRLELALRLQASRPALQARPGFMAASQARLLEQIRAGEKPRPVPFWRRQLPFLRPGRTFNLVTLALALLCVVTMGQNLILGSRLALPGETLYPLKRGIEQAQLALSLSPAGDTRLQIEFSQRRAAEIVELILDEQYDQAPYATQLLGQQVNAGLESLDALAGQDAALAEAMGQSFAESLANEQLLFDVLLQTYPPLAHPVIKLALEVTQYGLETLHD